MVINILISLTINIIYAFLVFAYVKKTYKQRLEEEKYKWLLIGAYANHLWLKWFADTFYNLTILEDPDFHLNENDTELAKSMAHGFANTMNLVPVEFINGPMDGKVQLFPQHQLETIKVKRKHKYRLSKNKHYYYTLEVEQNAKKM